MALHAGTRFGPYEITAPLDAGGMGEIYRARDTELGRDVAIKVLPAAFASDAARVARFEQEAKILASLNHARIAQIYGLARIEGVAALAMELVEGATLAQRLAHGPLPVEEALDVAAQIVDALGAAHERGIVHRDLKPANIKITRSGTVKVLDFGIAKALDVREASGPGRLALTALPETEVGFVLGTVAYMSPEQARGKSVDERTDIWAFGCVLYEMLTGQPVFLADDATSTLALVLEGSPDFRALPTRVSPAVRRTLELCLEKDPRKRLADMRDVGLALTGAFTPAQAALPRWRRTAPFAATLALGALLAGLYAVSQRPIAPSVESETTRAVARFLITPPETAPLAETGDLDIAISRDGQRIAYWARRTESGADGELELYVREFGALEARAVPGTAHAAAPTSRNLFFSPDGRSIGYGAPGGSILSVALDGRPPVRIVERVAPNFLGAWWSDDDTVIFSSFQRLERVSATGGGVPEPLLPARQQGGIAGPVRLPGGRAVLFHAFDGAGDRVMALDLETGQEKVVVAGGSNPAYVDTGHLVFARGNTLMAAPFDASELAVTGEAVALVQDVRRPTGGAADYAISANGTLAYVPRNTGEVFEAAVVWVDRTGQVLSRAVPDLVRNPRHPRLSPDGERLLLVTGDPDAGQIWSYDLGGRPPIPLALSHDSWFPVWSPDGRQVAFLALGDGVKAVASDGSERAPRALGGDQRGPEVWSAAGELIFTIPLGDIFAMPVNSTGEARSIVDSDFVEFDPALSPDGRLLAYTSDRSGGREVWVQAYPAGAPVRVSSAGGEEPLWSADGRELFYRQGDAVMAIAVETSAAFSFSPPQRLFAGPYVAMPEPFRRAYAVARDGRFLMFLPQDDNRAATPGSIVVVQNFAEEIKRRTDTAP